MSRVELPRSDDAVVASWRRNAAAWIEAVRGGMIRSRRVATDAAVLAAVRARSPRRLLDIGCGEGWLAAGLADHGVEVVGFDAVPVLVDAARSRGGGQFHCCDYAGFIAAPLRFGRFDAAVANFSLFAADLRPLLTAVHVALRPGGTLIVQTLHPQAASPGWRQEDFAALSLAGFDTPMPWYLHDAPGWRQVLACAGFAPPRMRATPDPEGGPPLSLLLEADCTHDR